MKGTKPPRLEREEMLAYIEGKKGDKETLIELIMSKKDEYLKR